VVPREVLHDHAHKSTKGVFKREKAFTLSKRLLDQAVRRAKITTTTISATRVSERKPRRGWMPGRGEEETAASTSIGVLSE